MKILICLFILISFPTSGLYAQYYPEVWDSTAIYENDYLKIEVPKKWRYNEVPKSNAESSGMLMIFEGSGIGFPYIVNDNPFIVNATIVKAKNISSLDSLETLFLEDMQKGKDVDKVFEDNYTPLVEEFTTKSGNKGKVVKHRYFRKSKGLSQSRYSLLVLNEETKNAFVFGISYQYDGSYKSTEDFLNLTKFSKDIFNNFELK